MQKAINLKVLVILIGALIFSMYQETPARRTKKTDKKTVTIAVKPVAPTINYTVSMSKPWTHLLEVEMRLDWAKMPEKAELKMPVWTPGSYLIREYARHVEDFTANSASGNALTWQKTNKNTWQIDTKAAKQIVIKYNVYANELTVRTNELNADHAFFNNAALLMFPKDQLNVPSTVKVVPFGKWKVATGLPKVEGQTNAFRAENFDVLYDSPFEVGDYKEISFDVKGKSHRYVVEGEGDYDLQKIAVDTAKIIEEGYKIFGDLPYNDYLFILNLRGGGGLEHLNSTALQWNKFGFKPESRYRDFLTLVAHEYFHLWNVKRIKPDALGPFDYENENYTKLLWVAEGGTAYYEGLLVERAGLMSDKDFLASKATQLQALQNRPGRFETSLENASFDAWIKYYRPDENAVNNQISYYDKGEIINFLLDIEIRKASNGAKSLDDVMRYLYAEFAKKNKNYTPEDFQKIAETMAGKSLNSFFSKYVRGREEIDYNSILNDIGLQLTTGSGIELAYLGADFVQQGERLLVKQVQIGAPAYEQGLNANDQIVAMDGFRVTQTDSFAKTSEKPSDSVKDFSTRLEMKKPGDKIRLTVFRFDELREIEITLGGRAKPDFKIVAVDNPTKEQQRLYQSYMGTELK
ncbi:MAG: M61 family metallopeptidase [Acidobacteria bacterium]|nr:M61 family metallopeptidase [Acidobacteriota bacterium]